MSNEVLYNVIEDALTNIDKKVPGFLVDDLIKISKELERITRKTDPDEVQDIKNRCNVLRRRLKNAVGLDVANTFDEFIKNVK